jgi:type IV secretion system protein VirB6
VFERFDALLAAFVANYAQTVATTLAAGLAAPALLLVTAKIVIFGLAVMRGEADEPLGQFTWNMVQTMAVLTFAIGGLAYSQWVLPTATQAQDGMATLFIRGLPAGASAFAALDAVNNQANDLLKVLWRDATLLRVDLVVASLLFSAGTAAFLIVGLAVSFVARVLMVFVLAVGPLFILSLLFKSTRRFFDSWLSLLLAAAVTSWFVFFALGLSLNVATRTVDVLNRSGAFHSGTVDGVFVIEAAGTYLAVMAALAFVLYQAPRLASALTGGPAVQSGLAMVARYVGGGSTSNNRHTTQSANGSGAGSSSASSGSGSSGGSGGSLSRVPTAYTAGYGAGRSTGTAVRHAYQRLAGRHRP